MITVESVVNIETDVTKINAEKIITILVLLTILTIFSPMNYEDSWGGGLKRSLMLFNSAPKRYEFTCGSKKN